MNKQLISKMLKLATSQMIKRKLGVDSHITVSTNAHGVIELKVKLLIEDVQNENEAYYAAACRLNDLIISTVLLNGKVHDVQLDWTSVDKLRTGVYCVTGDMEVHVTFNPLHDIFTDSQLIVITTSNEQVALYFELKNMAIDDIEICA